jgi:putative phage-type endonuclease
VPYTIIKLQQGTDAWHEWREQGIGSSEAPVIMGENPWKSADDLFKVRCRRKREETNPAMARGTALEPEARRCYESRTGFPVYPACLQNSERQWLRASVDGLAGDGESVVEIKCGERTYHRAFQSRKVPDYYYGQLQHILAVTGLFRIDFFCYHPDRPEVHLQIERSGSYIDRLLEAEWAFWQKLERFRLDSGG